MPSNVTILQPVDGETVKVKYSWPADVEVVNFGSDGTFHRYVIFFCEKSLGNAAGTRTFDTGWEQLDPRASEHSLSAVMVEGNTIVDRDRRMVRTGQIEA